MVDLIKTGLAFVILMLSLSTFFGIAIFIYVGYVKGFPTRAGVKSRFVDFGYWITCRSTERIIQQYEIRRAALIEKKRQAAHDLEMAQPQEASTRPAFDIPDDVIAAVHDLQAHAQYGDRY